MAAERTIAENKAPLHNTRSTAIVFYNPVFACGFENLEDPFQKASKATVAEDHSTPSQDTTSPAQTLPRPSVFRLHGEIRQQIYRLLFRDSHLIYETQTPDRAHIILNGHRAILHTCHAINNEAAVLSKCAIMDNFFRRRTLMNYVLTTNQIINLHRTAQITIRPNGMLPTTDWIQTLKSVKLLVYLPEHFEDEGGSMVSTKANDDVFKQVKILSDSHVLAFTNLWVTDLLFGDREPAALWIVVHVAIGRKDMVVVWDYDTTEMLYCVERS
jgi:hypothetical protein